VELRVRPLRNFSRRREGGREGLLRFASVIFSKPNVLVGQFSRPDVTSHSARRPKSSPTAAGPIATTPLSVDRHGQPLSLAAAKGIMTARLQHTTSASSAIASISGTAARAPRRRLAACQSFVRSFTVREAVCYFPFEPQPWPRPARLLRQMPLVYLRGHRATLPPRFNSHRRSFSLCITIITITSTSTAASYRRDLRRAVTPPSQSSLRATTRMMKTRQPSTNSNAVLNFSS
jgi:hypothetical protein